MQHRIDESFEKQVSNYSDRLAIVYKDKHITYDYLNKLANKLANLLILRNSVKQGDVVGISLTRSEKCVVAQLAVLKIGATYIAIDPQTPNKRIKYICNDANVLHLLTSKSFVHNFLNLSISYYEIEDMDYLNLSSDNLKSNNLSNPIAYILYTSGTTGMPKGVLVGSLGVKNYVKQIAQIFLNTGNKRIAYLNSPYTDLGYTALYTSLLSGMTLCILADKEEFAVINLLDYLRLELINMVKTTPSYYQLLANEIHTLPDFKKNQILAYLKSMHFIIGGEALLAKHLILDVKVSNHYGPTETTIGVATYTVEEPINKIVSNIPIGKALKNTRIYILNKEMDIMPIATQGEIYIGGLGVAFGYVNQAGLTAEKFIANPFRTIEERNLGVNSRLYKTGDFAKYLPDGNIEFLGRKDEQVKIRGYRVELKEIEEAINTHGDIKDCMVIVKNSLLIAYIVSGEFAINAEELELYLEDIIPKHMIPHHYVMIDRIPLTIAGKRNKDGLPIFSETDLINNEEYEEAQESVEKSLCEIWQEILSVKKIGRNDNFFKLGGHSLLVIKLISRIKKKFTVDIRLIDLFDNPTISEMRNLIQSSTTTALITISIPPLANKLKSAPLSFAQHRLWFLEKLIADVVYNMPVAFELLGALDRVALRKSLASIVQRHKIFRTVFKEANAGDIRQVILQDMSIYEEIDLTYKTNQQDIIDELKEKEAKNKFDLQIGPLCRIKLLILNQEKHILIMTKHHIISDGWSFRILFKEITEFYAHYAANKELLLPKLKIQYIDYSVWQRNWFKNEQLQQQITYWQSKLMDAPINTTLPSDKMRPKEVSFQGRHHLLKVDLELSKKIEDICQRNNISIYMFFLTILNILIYKVTGDQDLVIGRLVTGRQHEEIENLIGLFVNTSVIRSYITRQKSFKKLLLEVKNNLLESYQFQDIPFEKLINLLKLDRVANQNPLFQILIDFKDLNNESSLELEGIAAKDISANYDIVKFDLEFIIYKLKDNSLAIRINYLLDIFHYKTIKRFAEFFENIVKNVVDNTEISIGNINIASVSEQNTQINLLNKGKLIYENQQPILFNQLFAQNITTNPDRIAVWDKGKFITYKELDRKINCLIAYFYNQGVKPSEYIAYCGPRDVDAVIAMLAIFKLGAIYVPIDRNYPDERISFILLDSEAKWLITSTAYHDKFKKLFLGEIILIDSYKNINHNNIKNTSIKTILEHNLAYLIYTSGTTGRPKGVMISHYSMAIRLASFDKLFKLQPEDKVAQQASLSFDVSLQEILCPLTSGAAIYFVVDETVRQPDDLIDSIEQNQITFIEFIPSFLQNLLISYNFTKNNSINKIVVGGEPLTSSLIEIFNSKLNAELINMCGPTEVCMDATYWLCDDKLPKLGTPLEYTHAYILDHDLNITPRDFAGELYFSTQAMARGYKGKAKLTAEKFIADIFTNTGNRLYKSGDIVKLLPDGNLDFLGRKDFQLKIRGYRVEIEEIEKILENYPDIKQIAITYKKHSHNNNYYLLCYYSAIKKIEDIQIINYIERYLPDYMIPSAFVFLISMPTTINGKVDKQALPEFILSSGDYYHAPKNKIEKILCEIWQDVLGINKVGTKDNFFRLGGDSIITLQILSKARRQSINFKLKDLFNHPEISSLSKFCQFIENNKNAVVSNKKIRGVVALTPIQSDFFNQVESYNYFNQSIVLSYLKELNIDYMQEALSAIIMHHDMLRAQYSFNKNKPTQVKQNIIDKVNFVFSYKDLSQNIDPFRMLGKEFNTIHTKINIFTPKLIGMGIYFLGKDKGYRIFITIHHLVIDEVSWRILKEDLEKAYSQLLNKEKINFDYKTTSFQKWSYLIKDYISEIKGHEKTFWQKLDNSIKKDYYNYKVRGIAKELVKNLDNTFTNRLLREVNKAYQTEINDILLTAMSLAYADWYLHLKNVEQQLIPQEIIIDLEGHGREILAEDDYTDLSRTIGWFTSIYPVDLSIKNKENNIGNIIKDIKERLRNIPNKGIGYGILKTNGVLGNINNNALKPNILFNFLGQKRSDKTISQNNKTLFNLSFETKSLNIAKENQLSHKISINCAIYDEVFSIRFTFDINYFSESIIKSLANCYISALKSLVEHCCEEENFGYTLSDFKNVDFLTQQDIDQNLSSIKNIEDIYKLSPLQEGFLFNEEMLLDQQSIGYNVQSIYSLDSDIDVNILKKAWDIVIKNNTILRTGFLWKSLKESIQFIIIDFLHDFRFSKYKKLSKNKILELATIERSHKFDFTKPPINKILLLIDAKAAYMIWTTHHIVSDGWSSTLLIKELKETYHALLQGTEFSNEQRIEYGDYIQWIQRQNKEEAIKDWTVYLAGFTEDNCLRFAARTVLERSIGNNKKFSFTIDKDISNDLKDVAKANNITFNTVFQAVFGIILSKYTQLTDFSFGIVISGRSIDLENIEDLIGLTINTLPLRIKINKKQTIKDFLDNLQNATSFINQTSFLSLAQIQKLFVKSINNLFNTILVYENYSNTVKNATFSSLELVKFYNFSQTEYPFALVVHPGEQFNIVIIYNDQYFTKEFLELFRDNFLNLLTLISKSCSEESKNTTLEQLLYKFNDNIVVKTLKNDKKQGAYCDKVVHTLFEEQIEEIPDKIALVYQGKQISYEELNRRANCLGSYLREECAVNREVRVGLCLKRNEYMLIAILGVLKAGGCYVPMAPDYPAERMQYIIKDANCRVVICNKEYEEKLKGLVDKNRKVISLDSKNLLDNIMDYKEDNLKITTNNNNLAYIIYTSGTTGEPKGVCIEHKSLVNYIKYILDAGIVAEENIMYMNGVSTDLGNTSLYGSIIGQKKLYIVKSGEELDITKILEIIKREKIEAVKLTPTYYSILQQESRGEENKKIMQQVKFIIGGEKLRREQIGESRKIINHYGPTEATIGAIINQQIDYNCHNDISIGKGISNVQVYILDEWQNILPIGAIGEIHIGGIGLARGYINRASLTAEKFVANPFATEEDIKRGYSRLYKTGDLGRLLPDGNTEYLRRNDEQVKIRGYRIELGEIESILTRHGDVKNCKVLVNEVVDEKKIVSYIVAGEFEPSEEDLNEYLHEYLPEYMRPSKYVILKAMPFTSTGKIDKNKLPGVNWDFREDKENYVAPRNDIEKKICEIWKEVLRIDKVGIKDDFYRLGGDSIKLMQMLSLMYKQKLHIPISQVYNNPNIREMSLYIANNNSENKNSGDFFNSLNLYNLLDIHTAKGRKNEIDVILPITTTKEKLKLPKLFLIHPGGGLSFSYMNIEKYLEYCVYSINNPYFFDVTRFKNIEQMAEHYLEEIVKIQLEGIYYIAGYSFGGFLAYAIAILLQDQKKDCKVILLDTAVNIAELKGEVEEAKFCDDTLLNEKLNENVKHFSNLSMKYKFKPISSMILFLKNKKNKGSLKKMNNNCKEIIIKGTHATFLEEDIKNLTKEINNFKGEIVK